ncbi:hypothetical protein D3C73_809140 [compost metagenome]
MVDVVEVDEQEGRALGPDVVRGQRGGFVFGFAVGVIVDEAVIVEVAEPLPVVDRAHFPLRILVGDHLKDGGEEAARTGDGRGEVELAHAPVIAGHAMLLGAGAADHGRPVGAAGGRQDPARVHAPAAVGHHVAHDRSVGLHHSVGAQPVHADDDHVAGLLRALAAREGGDAGGAARTGRRSEKGDEQPGAADRCGHEGLQIRMCGGRPRRASLFTDNWYRPHIRT